MGRLALVVMIILVSALGLAAQEIPRPADNGSFLLQSSEAEGLGDDAGASLLAGPSAADSWIAPRAFALGAPAVSSDQDNGPMMALRGLSTLDSLVRRD
jgi:hypothetical protein